MTVVDAAPPRLYYQDELVSIYHGDCRAFDWAALAAAEPVVVVTDPPYGISANVGRTTDPHRGLQRSRRGRDFTSIVGDDEPFDPAWVLALGLPTVLFGANHYADRLPPTAAWIVWDKRFVGQEGRLDQADAELAWTNLRGVIRLYRLPQSGGAKAREDMTSHVVRVEHPTQKPLGLMRRVIQRVPDGLVVDPYAGSGSTLVAAKDLGRRSLGIEIEERYCETAARRCSQMVLGLGA